MQESAITFAPTYKFLTAKKGGGAGATDGPRYVAKRLPAWTDRREQRHPAHRAPRVAPAFPPDPTGIPALASSMMKLRCVVCRCLCHCDTYCTRCKLTTAAQADRSAICRVLYGRFAPAAKDGGAGDDETAGLLSSDMAVQDAAQQTALRPGAYRSVATGPSDHWPVVASFTLGVDR